MKWRRKRSEGRRGGKSTFAVVAESGTQWLWVAREVYSVSESFAVGGAGTSSRSRWFSSPFERCSNVQGGASKSIEAVASGMYSYEFENCKEGFVSGTFAIEEEGEDEREKNRKRTATAMPCLTRCCSLPRRLSTSRPRRRCSPALSLSTAVAASCLRSAFRSRALLWRLLRLPRRQSSHHEVM